MINKRLSNNSSSQKEFDDEKEIYQDALKKSGFTNNKLTYKPTESKKPNRRNRHIIWFNPPYNEAVTTNIGKIFFNALNKHFPKSHRLHKIFNKNTVKLSYSCTKNMKNIISGHNKKIIKSTETQDTTKKCNCQKKAECPLKGNCQTTSIIYRGKIITPTNTHTYIGATETTFKVRHANHKKSFKWEKYAHESKMSQKVWELKNNETEHTVEWEVLSKGNPYKPGQKNCDLCNSEALQILIEHKRNKNCVNKRSERVQTCFHRSKWKLGKLKL